MAPIECDDDGLDDIEDMGFLGEMVNAGKKLIEDAYISPSTPYLSLTVSKIAHLYPLFCKEEGRRGNIFRSGRSLCYDSINTWIQNSMTSQFTFQSKDYKLITC